MPIAFFPKLYYNNKCQGGNLSFLLRDYVSGCDGNSPNKTLNEVNIPNTFFENFFKKVLTNQSKYGTINIESEKKHNTKPRGKVWFKSVRLRMNKSVMGY